MGILVAARRVTLGVLLALLFVSNPSHAEEGSKESARVLADRGWELFEAGRYDEAIAVLEKAHEQFPAPTLLLVIARAHDRAGHLVQSRDVYQRIVSEPLASDAPVDFRRARETAATELTAVRARIPTLALTLGGAVPERPRVKIDGVERTSDALKGPVALDPGVHSVEVSGGPNGATETRRVTLKEGTSEKLTIEIAAPAVAKPSGRPPRPRAPSSTRPVWPIVVSYGIGAVGIGVGVVTGLSAMSKARDVKDRCVDGHCLKEDEDTANQSKTLGTISTIGFVVGGLGIGTGTVLLVMNGGQKNVGVAAVGRF